MERLAPCDILTSYSLITRWAWVYRLKIVSNNSSDLDSDQVVQSQCEPAVWVGSTALKASPAFKECREPPFIPAAVGRGRMRTT